MYVAVGLRKGPVVKIGFWFIPCISLLNFISCHDPKLNSSSDPPTAKLIDSAANTEITDSSSSKRFKEDLNSARKNNSHSTIDRVVPNQAKVEQIVAQAGTHGYFITVAHLSQSGRSSDLDVFRYGVTKALNSISTNPKIVRLNPIDPAQTVYNFNPSDFRLNDNDINLILRGPGAEQGVQRIGDSILIKADWLVYSITRPEIYDLIMRIPNDVGSLERQLGITPNSPRISGEVPSGHSEVTFERRTLIRIPIDVGGEPGGYYWRSVDYFQFLTAGEFFFSLPNGLQGYMLSGFANQHRIDAQPFVATDRNRAQDGLNRCVGNEPTCGYVINGESCITCHANGVKLSKSVHSVQGGTQQDFENLIAEDGQRFSRALSLMGFDNVGTEPILATLKAFRSRSGISDQRENGSEVNPVPFNGGIFQR